MSTRRKRGFASAALVTLGLFWGCGGSLGGSSGGESHFLIQCDDSCSDGLSCIAGICTRGCVIDEDGCGDLHADAECTDSIEPGEVAICDVACSEDADCGSLGANYSCEAGQCRGTTNVSTSGSGGTSSNGGSGGASSSNASGGSSSSGGPGGGGADGGSCELLFQEYPDGASFNHPAGCEECTCTEGEVSCADDGACELGVPVFQCTTDNPGDAVDVNSAFIQGDLLLLDVSYGGGCEIHDFGVCYEPTLGDSETPGAILGRLRLVHDSHDDPCEAEESETLHFNLRPYADYVTEELDVAGGLVETSFGHYAFGELSCDLAHTAALRQLVEAAEQTLDFSCSADSDCTVAAAELTCVKHCGLVVSAGGEDRFGTTLDHIQLDICDQYDANGCGEPPTPQCATRGPLACVEGRCIELEE